MSRDGPMSGRPARPSSRAVGSSAPPSGPADRAVDAPFWQAAAEGRLVVQRCLRCSSGYWPPVARCGTCSGGELVWAEAPPEGRVWSYAVYHRQLVPGRALPVPYAVAAVEVEPGVCLPGRITGSLDRLAVGSPVRAVFDVLEGDLIGPLWEVRTEEDPRAG